ncbi:MAG: cobyrinic acid a,c-diamide synthase [Methanoculleus sp. SDB]|nr:MAG: cobyrinic acid a,c-diamide synthase [Methanoculleus sp. SDB]
MIPRIVIAGTHSGCGKTSIASGIMVALIARGYRVQPFKVGPDFIDPTHHTAICGRPSRNLDAYMMGEEGVLSTFHAACRNADIAVIEGVMGMFDGLDGTDTGSTAHIAKILDAPVLLVADVNGMSRSAHALTSGYAGFDTAVRFAGVIFNRIGSPRHRSLIAEERPVPVFGWVPVQTKGIVESRHLGLRMAHETTSIAHFGSVIEEHCDLDGILAVAGDAPPLPELKPQGGGEPAGKVRIGVALDEAFCFYYRDNLDLLAREGADLVFFSPIRDKLPDVDGIYLGGGYPELHAAALSRAPCREDLARAAGEGMPLYAECGGLAYLSTGILTDAGEYPMVGVLPARAVMQERFAALGYVDAMCTGGTPLVPAGLCFRGHEFHYSRLECDDDARFAFRLQRGQGIRAGRDGMYEHSVLAGYTHAYFTPEFASSLIAAAGAFIRE